LTNRDCHVIFLYQRLKSWEIGAVCDVRLVDLSAVWAHLPRKEMGFSNMQRKRLRVEFAAHQDCRLFYVSEMKHDEILTMKSFDSKLDTRKVSSYLLQRRKIVRCFKIWRK